MIFENKKIKLGVEIEFLNNNYLLKFNYSTKPKNKEKFIITEDGSLPDNGYELKNNYNLLYLLKSRGYDKNKNFFIEYFNDYLIYFLRDNSYFNDHCGLHIHYNGISEELIKDIKKEPDYYLYYLYVFTPACRRQSEYVNFNTSLEDHYSSIRIITNNHIEGRFYVPSFDFYTIYKKIINTLFILEMLFLNKHLFYSNKFIKHVKNYTFSLDKTIRPYLKTRLKKLKNDIKIKTKMLKDYKEYFIYTINNSMILF